MAFLISIPAAGWQHFPLCIPEATACEPVGEDGGKKGPVTAVAYTQRTLPTIDAVYDSVAAVSLKQKSG